MVRGSSGEGERSGEAISAGCRGSGEGGFIVAMFLMAVLVVE
jgi:hypothetical protein